MNKAKKFFRSIGAGAATLALTAPAYATNAIDVPDSVDTSAVFTMAGVVLVGLVAMWGIRKVIKLTNRS